MTDNATIQTPKQEAQLAMVALQALVPSVRESILSDPSFLKDLGLTNEPQLAFGPDGPTLGRGVLFSGVRQLFSKNVAVEVIDVDGRSWHLETPRAEDRAIPLTNGSRSFLLPEFSVLAPDEEERLHALQRTASVGGIDAKSLNRWREILASRPLLDEELAEYWDDIQDTPTSNLAAIESSLRRGKVEIGTLAPTSRRYFDRLVGEYQQAETITEYASRTIRVHIESMVTRSSADGLWQALLLCSHSVVAEQLPRPCEDDLLAVLRRAATEEADTISKVGAIQLGLSMLAAVPDSAPILNELTKQVLSDDPQAKTGRFALLSALFVLVDGELSRSQLFMDRPPFWRRLAALSQASLIERAVRSTKTAIESLCDWAVQMRVEDFYTQTMVDLRIEPRWHPDYASPNQLKMEMLGRLLTSSKVHQEPIASTGATELQEGKLGELASFPLPFISGPLEGGVESTNELPPELARDIEERLNADSIDPASFISIVNSVLVFRLDAKHAELAARAIRNAKYMVGRADHPVGLEAVLSGLASVAAISRSEALAKELVLLTRRARRSAGLVQTADEAMALGLIAAAAHEDAATWATYVGEWMTELAFDLADKQDARRLRSHIRLLCRAAPSLGPTCGKAEAALLAVAGP